MTKTIKTIGVLIFRNSNTEVLLVKHNINAEHKTNKYGLPAGRLDTGETEVQTAIRELKEETGLITDSSHLRQLPTEYSAIIETKEGPKPFSYKVFLCDRHEGTLTDSLENIPVWVRVNNIKKLDLLPNIENVISEGLARCDGVPERNASPITK